jgi:hypothetical protein
MVAPRFINVGIELLTMDARKPVGRWTLLNGKAMQ